MTVPLQGDDSYDYSNLEQMTTYSQATAPAIALDENDVVWAIWDYINSSNENNLMWDRTQFNPELQSYIVAGSPVQIDWEINRVARASFTLARGDLFDPSNLSSIYAPVLKKGPDRRDLFRRGNRR